MKLIVVQCIFLVAFGFLALSNDLFYKKLPVDEFWMLETPTKILAYPDNQTPGAYVGKNGLSLIQRARYRSDILRHTFDTTYQSLSINLDSSSGMTAIVTGEKREPRIGHMPQSAVLLARPGAIRLNKFGFSWIETDSVELTYKDGMWGAQTSSGFITLGYFKPQTLEFQTLDSQSFIQSFEVKDAQDQIILSKVYNQTPIKWIELSVLIASCGALCLAITKVSYFGWLWIILPLGVLMLGTEWTALLDRYGLVLQKNEDYISGILFLSLLPLLTHWLYYVLKHPNLMRTASHPTACATATISAIFLTGFNQSFLWSNLCFIPLIWISRHNLLIQMGVFLSFIILGHSWGGILACSFLLATLRNPTVRPLMIVALIASIELIATSFAPLSNQILTAKESQRKIHHTLSNSCGKNPISVNAIGSNGLLRIQNDQKSAVSYLIPIHEQACSKTPIDIHIHYNSDARLSDIVNYAESLDPLAPLILQFGANDILRTPLTHSAISTFPRPLLNLLRKSTLISLIELTSLSSSKRGLINIKGLLARIEQLQTPTLIVLDPVNANYQQNMIKLHKEIKDILSDSSHISLINTPKRLENRNPDKLLANQTGLSQDGHQQLAAILAKDYIDWFVQIQSSFKSAP